MSGRGFRLAWCVAIVVAVGLLGASGEVRADAGALPSARAQTLWSIPDAVLATEDDGVRGRREIFVAWPHEPDGGAVTVWVGGLRPEAVVVRAARIAGEVRHVEAEVKPAGGRLRITLETGHAGGAATALVETAHQRWQGAAHDRAITTVDVSGTARSVSLSSEHARPRGIMIWGNGAGGDAISTHHSRVWRAFTAHYGFALVTTALFNNAIIGEQGDELLEAIEAIGRAHGASGWSDLPIVFTGHSNGGQMAYQFNAGRPEQMVAFTVSKGGYYRTVSGAPPPALRTPAMMVVGERDLVRRALAIHRIFTLGRQHDAPWSLVWEQGVAHGFGRATDLWLPFFAWAIETYFGETGRHGGGTPAPWIADNMTWQSGLTEMRPAAEAEGVAPETSWLPNHIVALAYRGATTFDNPLTLTIAEGDWAVDQGQAFALTVGADDFAMFEAVELWLNGEPAAEITAVEPRWHAPLPQAAGVHSAVAIGRLRAGGTRTSAPISWIVEPR